MQADLTDRRITQMREVAKQTHTVARSSRATMTRRFPLDRASFRRCRRSRRSRHRRRCRVYDATSYALGETPAGFWMEAIRYIRYIRATSSRGVLPRGALVVALVVASGDSPGLLPRDRTSGDGCLSAAMNERR